jgi:hypothetical protein
MAKVADRSFREFLLWCLELLAAGKVRPRLGEPAQQAPVTGPLTPFKLQWRGELAGLSL